MSQLQSNRKSRLRIFPAHQKGKNSLQYWWKAAHPAKVIRNFIIIFLARFTPSMKLKSLLYRSVGVKVGPHVSVGLMAMFDVFFPEEITIGANCVIGYNTVILGHEFLIEEWRRGPVVIGDNVIIGANCTILPGVRIGDGAAISAMSLVNKDVPAGMAVGGVPISPLGRAGKRESS
jgi:acetyltransferase-like isoleucine patch superfamily enzyme